MQYLWPGGGGLKPVREGEVAGMTVPGGPQGSRPGLGGGEELKEEGEEEEGRGGREEGGRRKGGRRKSRRG
jgi:hypothetical protein